ncbi:MAG: hypothetical protein HY908_19565, partial [Myxococcales bacterium]|nr:hypothetical protein [Myxococcales bacterium]
CNNGDDNCNGCVDEGYKHYADVSQPCYDCVVHAGYATEAACRAGQVAAFQASLASNPPDGTVSLLPCTTLAQQQQSATWLCYDPKDRCDEVDNNGQNGVDENQQKCGNPAHCPTTEVCNGLDDDCDTQTDEGGVCGSCVSSPETCDGCDNDCDGVADDGSFAAIPCGLASPPNCVGTISCKAPVAVPVGTCSPLAGYGTCTNNPVAETCNGIDDNCNGVIDDGVSLTTCVPAGHPPGLVYGGTSKCQLGQQACVNGALVCQGGVGPSSEVCNGIDDDCDGVVDDSTFGVGQPCGINSPPCTPGATACVNGALVCTGGVQPTPEVCDAVDNDCDGSTDEAPLDDGPLPGQNGCWTLAGNCCSFGGLTWCPPPGGNCYDAGSLVAPCQKGNLVCQGGSWACINDKVPSPEVCDGIDNNCNALVDDGVLPGIGAVCGSDVGECVSGLTACTSGTIDCVGAVGPQPEVCDNLDNDCDTVIDNGIPLGAPCDPPYDTVAYPDTNTGILPCQQGQYACSNGVLTCVGGLGPSPEVCDGIDNDCDGSVDETGAPPNGLDGTSNPVPPPVAVIGDACGNDVGMCTAGQYACVNGAFQCAGGQQPQPEQCDCNDNDCDAETDEGDLCGGGQSACIQGSSGCQCATPCLQGEFVECPAGQKCETVTIQATGQTGKYCVTDNCGNCATKTVVDANNVVQCAPAAGGCSDTPECVCKGATGCQTPCYNVSCGGGQVCSNVGPHAGECVDNTCYLTGCACGEACNLGACVDDPCEPNPCAADEMCKPTADFSGFDCVGSCAEVTCPSNEICIDGQCEATCAPPCAVGTTCDRTQVPPGCVTDQCAGAGGGGGVVCANGGCCDPLSGACGNCPCEGVACPSGEHCEAGQCVSGGVGGSGGGGSGPGGSGPGGSGPGGSGATGTGATGPASDAVWRLATGGGGCSCELAAREAGGHGWWLFGALGLGIGLRRRGRGARAEVRREP